MRVIERTKAISIRGNGLFHAQAEAFPISPPATCHQLPVTRHPRRKTPQFLRRRCPRGIPGRKRYHFRRRRLLTPSTSPPSTTIFLFLAILLFLRKILRINLPDRFIKPSEFHRFAGYILLTGKNCSGNKIFCQLQNFHKTKNYGIQTNLQGNGAPLGARDELCRARNQVC